MPVFTLLLIIINQLNVAHQCDLWLTYTWCQKTVWTFRLWVLCLFCRTLVAGWLTCGLDIMAEGFCRPHPVVFDDNIAEYWQIFNKINIRFIYIFVATLHSDKPLKIRAYIPLNCAGPGAIDQHHSLTACKENSVMLKSLLRDSELTLAKAISICCSH